MMNANLYSTIVMALNNLDDAQGSDLLGYMRKYSNPTPSTPVAPKTPVKKAELHLPEEKPEPKPLRGKAYYTDDTVSIREVEAVDDKGKAKKGYIVYLTIPNCIWKKDEKTDKMKNIAPWLRSKLKDEIKKDYQAVFAGNYDTEEFFWAFPSKKKADEYIKARKEYNDNKKSA